MNHTTKEGAMHFKNIILFDVIILYETLDALNTRTHCAVHI